MRLNKPVPPAMCGVQVLPLYDAKSCQSQFSVQNYWAFGLFFPSSDVKTDAKRLKLQRFESGLCFRLQVKKMEGLWGDELNQLCPFKWANLKRSKQCLRLAHSKGPSWLGSLTLNPPPFIFFTWRRKQNPLSKRCNFNVLAFVFTLDGGKSPEAQ